MSRTGKLLGMALALLASSGCASDITGPLAAGDWGGEGISFVVSRSDVTIEFDCASGRIDQPLELRAGSFSARGILVRGHGGPEREGEEPDMTAAVYDGTISGATLRLTVRPEDTGDPIGPYLLRRDGQALLRRCL